MKYQMIKTIERADPVNTGPINSVSKKAFEGIDLTNCSSNEFAIKNGWRKSDASSMFGESFTSFEVAYGFDYNRIQCKSCEMIFNSPIEIKDCITCGSANVETEKKHIRKPAIQESISFNPDLFKQAVDDLEKHPVKTEPSIDWQHLADTIGD
jgi:hypothetical protein